MRNLSWARRVVGLLAAVVAAGWPSGARGDEGAEAAEARGKAMMAAAKWQAPPIAEFWTVRCEAGGPVIVLGERSITALGRADGKELWKVTERVEYPRVIGGNDKVLAVLKQGQPGRDNTSPAVVGLSLADGTEKYRLVGTVGGHQEQVRGNLITVAMGLATPYAGPTMGGPRGSAPALMAYDLNTGQQAWGIGADKFEFLKGFVSDAQYLALFNNVMTVVDTTTGTKQAERPLEQGWSGAGLLTQADGTCLMMETREGTPNQRLLTMDLKTGKIVKTVDLPAEAKGTLVAMKDDVLVLVKAQKSGMMRQGDVSYPVKLTEEDKKEKIMAFDLRAGKAQWSLEFTPEYVIQDDVVLAGDVLLQGHLWATRNWTPPTEKWTLTALDLAHGQKVWQREQMVGLPVVYQDTLILSGANFLEGVDRRDGKSRWWIPTAGAPCEPVIAGGVMYFGVRPNGQMGPGRYDGIFAIGLEGK